MPGALAVQYGFAELGATSVIDLLNQVDGHTVQTADGPWELHTKVATTDADVSNGVGVVDPVHRARVARARCARGRDPDDGLRSCWCSASRAWRSRSPSPGSGSRGSRGCSWWRSGSTGLTVAVPAWPGVVLLLAGIGGDGRRRAHCDGSGCSPTAGWSRSRSGRSSRTGTWREAIRISPWLIVGAAVASWLYYGFGADGGGAVARPDHRDAAGSDRAGRGGAGPARARRTRPREGRDVARPQPRATRSRPARRCGCAASTGSS